MYGDNFKAGCELSKFIEAPVSRACCTGQDTDLRESIARSCTNLIQIKAWRDTKKRKKTLDHIENSCKVWEAKPPNSALVSDLPFMQTVSFTCY